MPASAAQSAIRPPTTLVARWGAALFTVAVIGAIAVVFGRSAGELARWQWRVEPVRLAASFLLVVLSYPMFALAWRQSLIASGGELAGRPALRIFATSQLARYLPGSVWNFVGRTVLCVGHGVGRAAAAGSVVLEHTASIACALLVFLASLPLWPGRIAPSFRPVIAMTALAAVLMLHPTVFARLLRVAARVMRSEVPSGDFSTRRLAVAAAHFIAAWIVLGLGFWAFATAVQPLPLQSVPVLAGGFPLAWVIGFVTLFAPSGLGIREAVATALLAVFVPVSVAGVIAVAFRLFQVLAELAWAAVASRL
jgi:hypothetical protein